MTFAEGLTPEEAQKRRDSNTEKAKTDLKESERVAEYPEVRRSADSGNFVEAKVDYLAGQVPVLSESLLLPDEAKEAVRRYVVGVDSVRVYLNEEKIPIGIEFDNDLIWEKN